MCFNIVKADKKFVETHLKTIIKGIYDGFDCIDTATALVMYFCENHIHMSKSSKTISFTIDSKEVFFVEFAPQIPKKDLYRRLFVHLEKVGF